MASRQDVDSRDDTYGTEDLLDVRLEPFLSILLANSSDRVLRSMVLSSLSAFEVACQRGLKKWIVTYSGGKDSTTVLVLALEVLKHKATLGWGPDQVDVIFSDTLLELPPVLIQVETIMQYLENETAKCGLPVHTHIVKPKLEQRFWYSILAKGYPPPHNRFRWCTDRLKIAPSETIIKHITRDASAVLLTGVRFAESDIRTGRLNAACSKGGECGQGVWFDRSSRLNSDYLAPIANWTTCKVWDFLTWIAPRQGWPTASLAALYGEAPIRFGCWTCPLVKEDRATDAVIQREQWAHLAPLKQMRTLLIEVGRSLNPDDRLMRSTGQVGKLSLERRKYLFAQLRDLEQQIGMEVLAADEAAAIQDYWESDECKAAIVASNIVKVRLGLRQNYLDDEGASLTIQEDEHASC